MVSFATPTRGVPRRTTFGPPLPRPSNTTAPTQAKTLSASSTTQAPPTPTPAAPAGYAVDKLIDGACATPPDRAALADLSRYVAGKDLTAADQDAHVDGLMALIDTVGCEHPRTYGLVRQEVLWEMRMRVVAQALQVVRREYGRGRLDFPTSLKIRSSLSEWERVFRHHHARDLALWFKVKEVKSSLAHLPITQTRRRRLFLRIKNLGLLTASVASTLLPFLQVNLAVTQSQAATLKNELGSAPSRHTTGVISLDLITGALLPSPRPAAWHRAFEQLQAQHDNLRRTRLGNPALLPLRERRLCAVLAKLQPRDPHIYRRCLWETKHGHVPLFAGVVEILEALMRDTTSVQTLRTCGSALGGLYAASQLRALRPRIVEAALVGRARAAVIGGGARQSLVPLIDAASSRPFFADAKIRYRVRENMLREVLAGAP